MPKIHNRNNIYIDPCYQFQYLLVISIQNLNQKIYNLIPKIWQMILLNDGSLTQTLHYLTKTNIKLSIFQKNKYLRCIWLENSIYTKLIFARSLWKINQQYLPTFINSKALGRNFIQSQVEVYKKLNEIYYGYSLIKEVKYHKPIWGRKYTLYYNNIIIITIQEFFSPSIVDFFL
uniref:Chorismate lyase n=1 Tax=Taenioma perpusillum TaxID=210852 RepID=A0A1Z1MQU6_9FLOR|nr:hypothetical protein [Taenioma perpusillum]ARW68450.1 hypothetical protein [Taenioma perpusillum]